MELEIQKYLRSKNLQDLIWDYDLQTFESEKYPELICFDYSILSPQNEQITREARGLVLEKNTWDIKCMSMLSFQFENELLNFENANAFVKYDGCLVILYFYQNTWITATRFSVDGNCYVASAYSREKDITWKDLFFETLTGMGIDKSDFLSKLNEEYCYSFEMCTKFNKNIAVYQEDFIKLISITNVKDIQEIDILTNELLYFYPDLEPEHLKIQSKFEIEDILSQNIPGYELEGYVVTDKNFNRIKMRNPNFDSLSKIDENANQEYIQRLIMGISPVDPGGEGVIP